MSWVSEKPVCPDAEFPGNTRRFPGSPGNHWLLVIVVSSLTWDCFGKYVSYRQESEVYRDELAALRAVTGLRKIHCPIDFCVNSFSALALGGLNYV